MKVIVCGAGQVGYNIARYLAGAGNDVTVIDQRPELTQKIGESLDIQAITGFASHPEVLEQAGAEDAEVLIAVTYADEVNMIACQVAHSLFNVPTKIARIRHQSYLQSRWQDLFRRERLPIDVIISPEQELARAIVRRLEVPGATEVTPFAEDRVRLIATRCGPDCPILDTPAAPADLPVSRPAPHLRRHHAGRSLLHPDRGRPSDRRRRGRMRGRDQPRRPGPARLRP